MLRNPMRLSWILAIITSTLLSSGYSALAQTPLTDCDRLAANSTDKRKHSSAPGVPFKQVRENVNAALSACADAVKSFPNELRFQYQYARALQIRDKKSASQLFVKLSENGYPAAFDNVGWIQISENNDYDAAIRAFKKGYELGDADCAVSLFEMIEREKWKPENEKQVRITLLEKAAAANHAGAVVALPIERAKHGTPPNDSTAAAPKPAAASTTTNDQQQPQAQPKVPTQAPAQAQAPNPSTWQSTWNQYKSREKSILEKVFNYSTQADQDGTEAEFWVSGLDGQNKCVMTLRSPISAADKKLVIDIRQISSKGFRIKTQQQKNPFLNLGRGGYVTTWTFGDEKTNFSTGGDTGQVMERLQKAWGLALAECPGKKEEF